jgi:hypothetical protein
MSHLVLTNLAFGGGEEADNKLSALRDILNQLEGTKEETLEGGKSPAWEWLKVKKRG